MQGRCLCGAVAFAIEGPTTPPELCHCHRCRRAYASTFAATFYARSRDFRWVKGHENVQTFDLPVRDNPPPYRHTFCRTCGSALPISKEGSCLIEIPTGLMDQETTARPAHQQWLDQKARWWTPDPNIPHHERGVPQAARKQLMRALKRS